MKLPKVGPEPPGTRSGKEAARAEGGSPPNPEEVARYVADMTSGLRHLSHQAGLGFLAYLLDMAAMEASERANRR